jgi:DNA-binding transcriptional regulator YhcF (GntR family)
MIKINPNISIFIQLANSIRMDIYSSKRIPGSKLESIRDMATLFEVNPNTIKRVYQELENEGLIYTDGNLGTYVIDDKGLIVYKRKIFIYEKFKEFKSLLRECGITEEELNSLIKKEVEDE